MKILYMLIQRNVKLYLRDKAAVFFSFLSVIIILTLYILFLGKMQVDSLVNRIGHVDGIEWLVSTWIMAGILTVSTITVPLGAVGNLIDDRADEILNDFYVSPISKNILALSYLISAWVIGFIMVTINMIIGFIYVILQGGELLPLMTMFKLIGVIVLSIMSFSSFFFFISLFMRTRNAYGTLATLVGTFIGFLGGIYIPIGQLGENVQKVMNILPTAHVVTLVRSIYMEGAINNLFVGEAAAGYDAYASMFGLKISYGEFELTQFHMLMSIIMFMVVFYTLSVIVLKYRKLS